MKQKLYDVVKKLLEDYPAMRDNDRMLMWSVWEKQGLTYRSTIDSDRFIYEAITPESITRCRRKIQEQHPSLAASEKVKELRKSREEEKGTHIFREEVVAGEDQVSMGI